MGVKLWWLKKKPFKRVRLSTLHRLGLVFLADVAAGRSMFNIITDIFALIIGAYVCQKLWNYKDRFLAFWLAIQILILFILQLERYL